MILLRAREVGRDGLPGTARLGMGWQPRHCSPWGEGGPPRCRLHLGSALGNFCRSNLAAQVCSQPRLYPALTLAMLPPGQGQTHIWGRSRPGCAAGATLGRAGRPLGGLRWAVPAADTAHVHQQLTFILTAHPDLAFLPTVHSAGSWPCPVSHPRLSE